jgi:hypothetical protein
VAITEPEFRKKLSEILFCHSQTSSELKVEPDFLDKPQKPGKDLLKKTINSRFFSSMDFQTE